jgi:methionine-rich copper-binding protein CopC
LAGQENIMNRMTSKYTFLAVVAGLLLGVSALQAHAKLEKTEPATDSTVQTPPKHVQLFFSEAPDVAVSKLAIKGPSDKVKLTGTHVMDKSLMAMVDGDMTDGLYTVEWQTAGDDGHQQKGEFSFTLKRK